MPEDTSGSTDLNAMLRQYADISSGKVGAETSVEKEETPVAEESESNTSDQATEVVKDENGALDADTGAVVKDAQVEPKKLPKKAGEAEREKKVLSAFSQKQEAFKKEREAFEAERKKHLEEIQKSRLEVEEYVARKRKEAEELSVEKDTEFTPEQWEEAAERWEQMGRIEEAKAAKVQAKISRQKQQKAQELKQSRALEGMKAEAEKWDARAIAENPELKDQNSDFFQEVKMLYTGQSDLNKLPRGLWLATEYVKQKVAASKVPELTKKVEELEKQLKSANERLTAPSGNSAKTSPKDNPTGSKNLDELSLEEKLAMYKKSAGY